MGFDRNASPGSMSRGYQGRYLHFHTRLEGTTASFDRDRHDAAELGVARIERLPTEIAKHI
jgi:hypothetical protein